MNMKHEAKAVLSAVHIQPGQNFESLSAAQAAAIRVEAEAAYQRKHGKPMPANSETYIRKRYDLLQIRART